MVIADDSRRFVAANPAACLLLRLAEAEVVRLRVDDLTPPENRSQMDALWEAFLRDRVQEGTFELMMPDGARLEVEYSATANVEPGLHVSILMFPPGGVGRDLRASEARPTTYSSPGNRWRNVGHISCAGSGSECSRASC